MTDPEQRRADELAEGLLGGDRTALARAITLVESRREADAPAARALVERVLPHTGGAHRVAISGVPGAGKSTLIEALGLQLVERGHRVAVLAIDPSSTLSGGSILGDKSRMEQLARRPEAFIRPSPSAATLGGVAKRTREAMLLLEAAGHDVVLVETVGVGQSETAARGLVDTFVVLLLPGAGDELQGIKKGILEVADVLAVNKADGEREALARAAARDHAAALRYLSARDAEWTPRTLTCSAATGAGIEDLWEAARAHRQALLDAGVLEVRRRAQAKEWMWSLVEERLVAEFRDSKAVTESLPGALERLESGVSDAATEADALLDAYRRA
ncbi:MAG: methylmalonyl Co-A mutase-associated GTPase MeaB [Planctomycetota bacterium]